MASGSSSGRVNLGSKGYDLGNEDILSSYSNLDSLNENYSDPGPIYAKVCPSLSLSSYTNNLCLCICIIFLVSWGFDVCGCYD